MGTSEERHYEMLIQVDAQALEVRVAAWYYNDKVLIDEIVAGADIHENNRKAFGLPSRLIAKVLIFRSIYGGSAYSFANDPDFAEVNKSEKYWQKVLDTFYDKYQGIKKGHVKDIQTVAATGKLVMPTGREYQYETIKRGNDIKLPETTIKNYPVQGCGADLMAIARVSAWGRLRHLSNQVKFVNTVHDSIVLDVANDDKLCYTVCTTLEDVFKDVPANFEKLFKKPFDIPMTGEVEYGNNLKEMTKFNKVNFKGC